MKNEHDFIVAALHKLGVTEWSLTGEPSSQAEFDEMFTGTTSVTWSQISAKVTELKDEEPMRLLRVERNRLIAETDWWVLPDRTATQAQRDYRQALRDITDTYTSLDTVVWPTQP